MLRMVPLPATRGRSNFKVPPPQRGGGWRAQRAGGGCDSRSDNALQYPGYFFGLVTTQSEPAEDEACEPPLDPLPTVTELPEPPGDASSNR